MTGRHTVPTAQMPSTPTPPETNDMLSLTLPTSTGQVGPEPKKKDTVALLNGLATGLLAVMVGGLLFFQLTHRPTYEYMTVSPSDYNFDEEMNGLGAQGWKTESCRRATSGSGYATTASYECIMSRPKLGW
ncbi:hypothetical protein [Deinococcus sp. DB0503]|uniref:hypothetical protein n=1 Tax=Deinococcus sp. DB0503 TaxID=2479203 RepID=UPI0018DF4389|nr:hypothetical protein [Deinococcus sp. DB0503]MBI0445348.1 hypothetical protein [Deinococcus sp. DB0503]